MTGCWHWWRLKVRGGDCAVCRRRRFDREAAMRRHPAGKKRP